jgi:hypothetical protein
MDQLQRSRFRFFALTALAALGAVAPLGCVDAPPAPQNEDVGAATIALVQVPTDVRCVRIQVQGTRTVSQDFAVMPGQPSVLQMTGLPLGMDMFSGQAFAQACGAGAPTWTADPVPAVLSAGVVASVSLVMHRSGSAAVSVDFQDDGTCAPTGAICGAPGQPACCAGLLCDPAAGICTNPAMCSPPGGPCAPGSAVTCCPGLACDPTGRCLPPNVCTPAGAACGAPGQPGCCAPSACDPAAGICTNPAMCAPPGGPCGPVNGQTCCNGLACDATGRCSAPTMCLPPNTPCGAAGQPGCCAPFACDLSIHLCLPPVACQPAGTACTADAQCCGLPCTNGVCGGPSCLPPGAPCNATTPCCAGLACNGGVCNPGPTCSTGPCMTDADCCVSPTGTRRCVAGLCTP